MRKRPLPLIPDEEGDNDYRLADESTGADVWIKIGPIAVCIHRSDEGVICDMWSDPMLRDDEPIATCYAYFSETDEAEYEAILDDTVEATVGGTQHA